MAQASGLVIESNEAFVEKEVRKKTNKKTILSVIMPVYNEGQHLREILQRIIDAPLPEGVEKEIIVIDDGSVDNTTEVLNEFASDKVITVHDLILNCGKGTAVRMGIKKAKGDIVIIQDGDLEYDPNDYSKVIQPIIDGEAEVVYGSRFKGKILKMKFLNRMGSMVLNILTSLLYRVKITDQFTAYKAFKIDLIKSLNLKCRGFEFCSEVTNKLLKRGIKIKEVPINYSGRTLEEGKKGGSWKDFFIALFYILEYKFLIKEV